MGPVIQENKTDEMVKFICNKYEKLKLHKSTWENHWKEIATFYHPHKDNIWGGLVKGEKKGQELYDSIGVRTAERFAGALHGMLVNPAVQWFNFSSGDTKQDLVMGNSKWLQDSAKKVMFVLNNSNFQPEIHEVFMDLSTFHTSHLRAEEDEVEVVRFTSRPIYEVSVSENYKGIIDVVYYEYKMTLEQLISQFGDVIPEKIASLRFQDPLKEYTVLHAIEPSVNFPDELKHPMLPFTSIHILKEEYIKLKVAGFQENPCIVSRLSKLSGEMFGRGPAMRCLADTKTCNQMMQTWLEGAALAINPPLQMPDEGVLLPVKFVPGGSNYYRADSRDRIEPIITGADPRIGNDVIELLHRNIEKGFYLDQLQLVENDRMTATEVMQRRDEQLRSLSPILGRLQYELLAPIVIRVFNIMVRRGLIDPPPQEMASRKLEVKFVSQLSRAQESIEAENFNRAFQSASGIAQFNPASLDIIDPDATLKFLFKTYGSPLHLLREDKAVEDIRSSRAEQQQAAQEAELAKVNSEAAKNNAQIPQG
jgi:hypothetical protein